MLEDCVYMMFAYRRPMCRFERKNLSLSNQIWDQALEHHAQSLQCLRWVSQRISCSILVNTRRPFIGCLIYSSWSSLTGAMGALARFPSIYNKETVLMSPEDLRISSAPKLPLKGTNHELPKQLSIQSGSYTFKLWKWSSPKTAHSRCSVVQTSHWSLHHRIQSSHKPRSLLSIVIMHKLHAQASCTQSLVRSMWSFFSMVWYLRRILMRAILGLYALRWTWTWPGRVHMIISTDIWIPNDFIFLRTMPGAARATLRLHSILGQHQPERWFIFLLQHSTA